MTASTLRSLCKIFCTFAGTLIGAGFASGQELWQFFSTYGAYGLVGIFCAGLLLAWFGWRILTLSYTYQLHSYTELIFYLCGKKIGYCLEIAISAFLFTLLIIMLAGSGTIAETLFAYPAHYGQLFISGCLIIIVSAGMPGITKINLYATPFLVITIASVSISSLYYHGFPIAILSSPPLIFAQPAPHWLLACLLYVAYNLALSLALLVPLGKSIADPISKKYGSILGGLLLAILAFLIITTLSLHSPNIIYAQIPMLNISCSQNPIHTYLYTAAFILALVTTALSCLYGCANKLQSILPFPYPICLLITIGAALSLTQIGFSQLISIALPSFGYATLWLLIKLLFHRNKN